MNQELLLENLDGFDFEELVADIFRKKGFKNVIVPNVQTMVEKILQWTKSLLLEKL